MYLIFSENPSPPGSPTMSRRNVSREENVFNRLTNSSNDERNDSTTGAGVIHNCPTRGITRAPLVCTQTAVGHKHAVLSVDATDRLLFSGSKGR